MLEPDHSAQAEKSSTKKPDQSGKKKMGGKGRVPGAGTWKRGCFDVGSRGVLSKGKNLFPP